jgi:hypothetical protein
MYIPEFWAGVLLTVTVEMAGIFIAAIIYNTRRKK